MKSQVTSGVRVVAPAIALPEVAGAIARRTRRAADGEDAVELILAIPGLSLVNVDRRLAQHSAGLAALAHVRGADAVYIAVADMLGEILVTWDLEQAARGADFVTVAPPG